MSRPNVMVLNQKGEGGGIVITGSETVSPAKPNNQFDTIFALQDSVLNLTASNLTGDSIANLQLKAGLRLYGIFTQVILLSGAVVCYNRVPAALQA